MNSLTKKIGTGIVATALMAASSLPAFASTDVWVQGNGAFSDNAAHVSNSNSSSVSQSNNSDITNHVSSNQSTGGNTASFNTGGSVTIVTGGASSDVNIANAAGSNMASVAGCGCDNGQSSVLVAGNGAFSNSDVSVNNWNRESYRQSNREEITNWVTNHLSTGHNSSDFNTGTDVVIYSGDTHSSTALWNQTGSNVLH